MQNYIVIAYQIVKDDDKLIRFPTLLPVRPVVGDWIRSVDEIHERKVTRVAILKDYLNVELDNPFWKPKND